MVQFINTQTAGLAAYIKNFKESDIKAPDSGESSAKTIDGLWNHLEPANIKNEDAVVAAIQWLSESKFVEKLHYSIKSSNQPNKSAKQHVTLTFKLTNAYTSHLILLRALFEFSSPSVLSVLIDRHSQTFIIEVVTGNAGVVTNYLETIFNQLVKEIDFKVKLKEIIQWEKQIKKEQNLVYTNVHTIFSPN